MKLTKVVCTIGPSSESKHMLKRLFNLGMNVTRLNLSHRKHAYHKMMIDRIRKVNENIAVLLDTKGPEIRTDYVKEPLKLKKGSILTLTNNKTDEERFIVKQSYKDLGKHVKKGDTILIADGLVQLKVLINGKHGIKCKVLSKCKLGSQKGICVPGKKMGLPGLTKKDIKDIKFGIRNNVDIIALSLIRNAETVRKVKKMIADANKEITVIAKIEDPEAVENINEILEESDGIMVARGDLGLSMAVERVPAIQKTLIHKANLVGKPVIVATQMLKSMVEHPRPTRAEASDVANAIYDGADALMLSEESAVGEYPIETVRTMVRIIRHTERAITWKLHKIKKSNSIPESIAESAHDIIERIKVKAVITPTIGGFTPNLMAKYKPPTPILALTHDKKIFRKLAITRGVQQFYYPKRERNFQEEHVKKCLRDSIKQKIIKMNDLIIIIYNHKLTKNIRTTNCLEVKVVGEVLKPHHYTKHHIAKRYHS